MSVFDEDYQMLFEMSSLVIQLFEEIDLDNCDRVFDLICAGADLDALDGFGRVPLQNCVSYEMVELLINHGAHPEQEDVEGKAVWMTGTGQLLEFIERAIDQRDRKTLAEATPLVSGVRSHRRL